MIDQRALTELPFCSMLVVTGKHLICTITTECNRYMFPGMVTEYINRYGGGVGKWFIYIVEYTVKMFQKIIIRQTEHRMICPVFVGNQLRITGFVKERIVFISYRKSIETIRVSAGQRHDQGRVYSSAQK